MKKNYITPETSIFDTKLRMSVLTTGSLTSVPMRINTVEVHEFEAGFDIGAENNDFKDIIFD